MIALMLPVAVEAQEMYAVVSNDGLAMTFYYDTLKEYRAGTIYYNKNEWKKAANTVTQVYFNMSFSLYFPKSTSEWFRDFKKLTSVNYLENLNLLEVTNMYGMFYNCNSLKELDVSTWDTRHVKTMENLFYKCNSLTTIDVRNLSMGNVESIRSMFYGCSSLTTLDLTDWDMGKIKDVSYVFKGCSNLTTIYTESDANWMLLPKLDENNPDIKKDIFLFCEKLVGGNGTQYDVRYIGVDYACVDRSGQSGYFTARQRATLGGKDLKNGEINLPCIKRGLVTYSESDHQLVLSDARIETDGDGIFAPDGIYITLLGDNFITCKGNGITSLDDTFLADYGTLTINSTDSYGISVDEMLEVSCSKLNVYGKLGAVDGRKRWSNHYNDYRCGYLTPYNSTITLSSDGNHPVIHDLGSIENMDPKGDYFYSYFNYEFNKGLLTVVDPHYEIPVTNPFIILPEEPDNYGIYLGGHLINEANKDDFRPQALSSGHVSYNPNTHKLTMDNAKFDRIYYPIDDNMALSVEAKEFTLELKGDNTLVGANEDGYDHTISMSNWHETNQMADCHFIIKSADPSVPATLHYGAQLSFECSKANVYVSISDVNLYNDGDWAAFWGFSTENGKAYLTVTNSTIDLGEGSIGGDMDGFYSVSLWDCHFANGFYYDANERVLKDANGDKNAGPVLIVRDNILGDVNNDGNVDEYDVNDIVSHIQGNTPEGFNEQAADVNEDGVVDYKDALIIGEMAGVPVGISDASHLNENEKMRNEKLDGVYDLQGRKINVQSSMHNAQLPKGIYIRNGKKVVVP